MVSGQVNIIINDSLMKNYFTLCTGISLVNTSDQCYTKVEKKYIWNMKWTKYLLMVQVFGIMNKIRRVIKHQLFPSSLEWRQSCQPCYLLFCKMSLVTALFTYITTEHQKCWSMTESLIYRYMYCSSFISTAKHFQIIEIISRKIRIQTWIFDTANAQWLALLALCGVKVKWPLWVVNPGPAHFWPVDQ